MVGSVCVSCMYVWVCDRNQVQDNSLNFTAIGSVVVSTVR